MIRAAALAALLTATSATAAPKLACTQDGTRKYFCIDENGVRSGTGNNAALRASKLYTGPPSGVSDSGLRIIADCEVRIATLQDRNGLNTGGGKFSDTEVLRSLTRWLCEAKKPAPEKALRQFGPN